MKKKILHRALLGFPLGVFLGYSITLIVSAALADGAYHPVAPSLEAVYGSQLVAVFLQFVFCGVIGSSFAAASVVFDNDRWSMFKKYMVYFVILSVITFPIAYFSYWMQHTVLGIVIYYGSFFWVYLIIWVIQYLVWGRKIKKMNQKIREVNK